LAKENWKLPLKKGFNKMTKPKKKKHKQTRKTQKETPFMAVRGTK
jgi:hypothetical protein